MTEEPEDLVLMHLKHICRTVEPIANDFRGIKIDLIALEMSVAALNQRFVQMDFRLERI